MKYIIDIDALKNCLGLLPRSFSDLACVDIDDVNRMIDAFPKEKAEDNVEDNVDKMSKLETCKDCGHYGWDMPQCKECWASNGFKYFSRK